MHTFVETPNSLLFVFKFYHSFLVPAVSPITFTFIPPHLITIGYS